MDRKTLANYGWIVVTILVLSVMIALTTPFGKYIGESIKNIQKGYTDVKDRAMERVDLLEFEYDDTMLIMSVIGDTNGDNQISNSDVLKTKIIVFGKLSANDLTPFDVNLDKCVDMEDYEILKAHNLESVINENIGNLARRNPDIKVIYVDMNGIPLSRVGDINQDTVITKSDAILLRDLLKKNASDLDLTACDINNDNKVNINDLDELTSYLLGEITSPHINAVIQTKTGIIIEY